MVTDTGGIDDSGFNGAAWAGLLAAQTAGAATVSYVQSRTEADYATNIASLQSQGCKTIVTVGGLMADATAAAAKASPDTKFIEVDAPGNGTNIRGIQYNTAEAGFRAGLLRASTWGACGSAPSSSAA